MGAWGPGTFENDSALDWANELMDAEDDGPLIEALLAIVDAPEGAYLDVDDCSAALGAAEVVAALGGRPSTTLPEDLREWVQDQSPEVATEIVGKCARWASDALARVKRGPGSECKDLWEEGDSSGWHAALDDLAARLRGL